MTVAPVRTLLFLSDLDGGGAQRTFVNLANALPRDRIAPTLVVGRDAGPARRWLNADTSLKNLERTRLRGTILPLRRFIRQDRSAVLLSTIADANVVAWLATSHLPIRLILRETNSHRARDDIGWLRHRLIALAYRRADAVVALSEGVRRELVEDVGLEAKKTHTIHNPVDIESITNSLTRRPAAPIPKGGPLILGVGRLTQQKNFALLLRCFEKQNNKNALLAILGDGPDRAKLAALARELGVGDRFVMPGFVDDMTPWFARADLFVLPSRWEGFGHVLAEAMAAGLPVVATDCPHGPHDIIENDCTGLLVANDNVDALTGAMQELLGDSKRARRLAKTGQGAVARFAPATIADQYATLIEQVIAS